MEFIRIVSSSSQGKIQGKKVSFAPYPSLVRHHPIEYVIAVRGVKEGDARTIVYLTSNLLKKPIPEEESTSVYK